MLKAHGGYVLTDNVPANEFLNIEGDKVSTSRNWAVWIHEYVKDFPGCEDVLRYVLCANAPETKDNDFTWKDFQERNNSELVAIFGNFVNRTWVLMHKWFRGKVPKLHTNALTNIDNELIKNIQQSALNVQKSIEEFKFRDALYEVIDLARKGNKYLQEKEPWKKVPSMELATTGITNVDFVNKYEVENTIHLCLQLCANLAVLINPFLPFTAKKMLHMMKVVDKMLDWENAGKIKLLSVGYSLRAPELLFRKIEDEEIKAQVEKLRAGSIKAQGTSDLPTGQAGKAPEKKSEIQYDDFAKLDLRVGTILSAEKVAKADKLLTLEVDLGFEKRTIVSGIALHFKPEDLIGRQVVIVANLAPRKLKGIESNGMILSAEDANGKLHLINPEDVINPGAGVS
jgi:methionyl-tRNA synthetase